VLIEIIDGNKKCFVESIDIEAKDENDAESKANEAFLMPKPQKLEKYTDGPETPVHSVIGISQLD
jgi:hypothetical protein